MWKAVVLICALAALAIDASSETRPGHHLPQVPTVYVRNERIVGGKIVDEGSHPHQVALFRMSLGFKSFSCGGSLISRTHVVTAAHCVAGIANPNNVRVRVGEHHLDSSSGNEQEIPAKTLTYHEDYNSQTLANDIAVIELKGEFDLNDFVQPIALPPAREEVLDGTCVVSGWGSTREGGAVSRYLREVTVPFVDDAQCQATYPKHNILGSMLCAGEQGKDSCQGDSGGPILCGGNKTLSGVVSWGIGCARAGSPGVYTQTSHFIDWIRSKAGLA